MMMVMMMMVMMMKRGTVKARTGMRTQDPRLAQHCDLGSAFTELAAKGRRKARLLSARDALQSDPSSRREEGRWRPPEDAWEPRPPAASRGGTRGSTSTPTTTTCWTRYSSRLAKEMLKFTPVIATCNIPGYTTIHNDQTAYIDYTGEERDYLTSGLAVNLYYEM